ncbi:MAG TPA: hypothetical protein VF624_02695 [Tepidisphaeraceae bacterium]|jgi:hypothetical protein
MREPCRRSRPGLAIHDALEPRRLLASISGVRFLDVDLDGSFDVSESVTGLGAVFVDLNENAIKDRNEPATIGQRDGSFSFTGLGPGDYTVRAIGSFSDAPSRASHAATRVTLTADANAGNLAFGFTRATPATRVGFYLDENFNGAFDEAESAAYDGAAAYLDLNDHAVRQADEPIAHGWRDAAALFCNLCPGVYTVRGMAGTDLRLAAGSVATITVPSDPNWFGGSASIGFIPVGSPASVTGRVFFDNNKNAVEDSGDTTPARYTFRAYDDANNSGSFEFGESTSAIDSSGVFHLHTAPGFRRIGIMSRDSALTFVTTTPPSGVHSVADPGGQIADGGLFGVASAGSIRGVTFFDANHNGVRDADETTHAGDGVCLDANGNNAFDTGSVRRRPTPTAATHSWAWPRAATACAARRGRISRSARRRRTLYWPPGRTLAVWTSASQSRRTISRSPVRSTTTATASVIPARPPSPAARCTWTPTTTTCSIRASGPVLLIQTALIFSAPLP